ncbi:MAG: hypothetical protein ACYCPP_02180 [Nitrososphaerales archaeon]
MFQHKTKIVLGAVLAVIIAAGLAGAAIFASPQQGTGISTQSQQSSSTAIQGVQSALIVQLTDPPIVPVGTTSLNLTYTSINLLVTVPIASTSTITSTITGTSTTSTSSITSITTGQKGQVTSQTITITPTSGSATVDLLKLQNISQTIASANLPSGSTIYSVSFVVSSITIEMNGVSSPVTLATGGNTLLVTLTNPAVLQGTNAVLLDLNPTIVNTPTGYQMIPSSIGIIKPQSEITDQEHDVGYTHHLTDQDQNEINHARGQVAANLVALSVSGSTSTITIQINNTGNSPVRLVAIGLRGNFTAQGCASTTSSLQDNHGDSGYQPGCESRNEVVLVPSVTSGSTTSSSSTTTTSSSSTSTTTTATTTSSTSTASCTSGQMTLVNADEGRSDNTNQLVIAPGQCITLTFSGTISFGQSGNALVPSTLAGQTYTVHVIASNGAETKLNCTLPLSKTSCMVTPANAGQD